MTSGMIHQQCPACGSTIDIDPDAERFVCAHCGTESVFSEGQTAKLSKIIERAEKVTERLESSEPQHQPAPPPPKPLSPEQQRLRKWRAMIPLGVFVIFIGLINLGVHPLMVFVVTVGYMIGTTNWFRRKDDELERRAQGDSDDSNNLGDH